MREVARQAMVTAETQAAPATATTQMGAAGATNTGTGEWVAYGLLDITEFGNDGFVLGD